MWINNNLAKNTAASMKGKKKQKNKKKTKKISEEENRKYTSAWQWSHSRQVLPEKTTVVWRLQRPAHSPLDASAGFVALASEPDRQHGVRHWEQCTLGSRQERRWKRLPGKTPASLRLLRPAHWSPVGGQGCVSKADKTNVTSASS